MESELYEAAMKGNMPSLLELLRKDRLLLDRIMIGNHTETPLHIAAMLGHIEFVEEVLAWKAELARVQSSQGLTPLHLAAGKGYLNIVASLLRVSPEVCFVRDKCKRNPLHVAAMKGHVDVLECLVRARPDTARSVIECGQTILHLCVKNNRLEALKLLIDMLGDDQFINLRDEAGNTILHLAAADRQTETIRFLENKGANPNITNSRGFTARDLLAQGESVERASEIRGYDSQTSESHDPSGRRVCANSTVAASHPLVGEEDESKRKRKWYDSMHQTLMVVAALLATLAYQASITPPGGLWQEDFDGDKNRTPHRAGESIMAYKYAVLYKIFVPCNMTSFFASLGVILLLISGFSLKIPRISTWIAMLTMWVALTFTAVTYSMSVITFTPGDEEMDSILSRLFYTVLAWCGLTALLALCHFVRLIVKSVRKVLKFVHKALTKRKPEDLLA